MPARKYIVTLTKEEMAEIEFSVISRKLGPRVPLEQQIFLSLLAASSIRARWGDLCYDGAG
jgi:hypothetical protein